MSIFLNDREVKFTTYPNGETNVPVISMLDRYDVRLHWESDQDLINLMFLNAQIEPNRARSLGVAPKTLFIDYMPYSRMDRAQDDHCFSLAFVAQFINEMRFDFVNVVEPHSHVTLDKITRSRPVWATAKLTPIAMEWMAFDRQNDYLVLPDAGAYKRYSELMPQLNQCHVIVLKKRRDFETGKIQGLEVDQRILRGPHDPGERHKALIIDDLSSRGGTFVQAADHLRYLGWCDKVNLLVTHMEPAGLLGDLRTKLNRVFCTDTITFPRPAPSNFEIFTRSQWT